MIETSTIHDVTAVTRGIELLNSSPEVLATLDASTRYKLCEAARKLNLATEDTGDSVHRLFHAPLQLSLAVVGVDTGLFDFLVDIGRKGATNTELAEKTNVDPALLKRLLRYYQSFGMIDQHENDQYRANNITSALASLAGRSGLPFAVRALAPAYNAIPEFLRGTNYKDITDSTSCPWNLGHHTEKHLFDWGKEHPEVMGDFMMFMASQRVGLPEFFDVIDLEKEFCNGAGEDTTIFVDVGGAMGHQCVGIRQKHFVGRVVLQDLPETIQRVKLQPIPGFEGIEAQEYNFFTPQPIRGARTYYFRNVLHDWPDNKCIEILENTKSAMTSDSHILVDEMVMPERGSTWRATEMDMVMSSCAAATERSQAQWASLFEKVGLKISEIWKYNDRLDECIMAVVPV